MGSDTIFLPSIELFSIQRYPDQYLPSSSNQFTITIDQSSDPSLWFGIEKYTWTVPSTKTYSFQNELKLKMLRLRLSIQYHQNFMYKVSPILICLESRQKI